MQQVSSQVVLPEVLIAPEQAEIPKKQAAPKQANVVESQSTAVNAKTERTAGDASFEEQQDVAFRQVVKPTVQEDDSAPTEPFQALFFEVAGLTIAVPLTQLGGIHNLTERNNIPGKPEWFDGVMVHRDQRFNVVDTAQWVMPEKYAQAVDAGLSYEYLILLEDSGWGLMCERLVSTQSLSVDEVKWSRGNNKRRWLAGLVKEQKCALINVDEMIELMDKGLNCQG